MSKCKRCNIEILDASLSCPLCNGVLEFEDKGELPNLNDENKIDENEFVSKSLMYPDVSPAIKRINFIIKLTIFCSIIVEGILIYINYVATPNAKWSAICGAGLLYACFSLIYSFRHNKSHRKKIMVQVILVMPLIILVDYALGYTGWSVNFGIPCVIAGMDIAILVLMLVNTSNWQSYIMLQVYLLVICIILSILMFCGLFFEYKTIMIFADLLTILLLAGTLVFGDKRATNELKRRFHV